MPSQIFSYNMTTCLLNLLEASVQIYSYMRTERGTHIYLILVFIAVRYSSLSKILPNAQVGIAAAPR